MSAEPASMETDSNADETPNNAPPPPPPDDDDDDDDLELPEMREVATSVKIS